MNPSAFVVMERGSTWPAHLHQSAVGCVALSQGPNEHHGELLRRTRDRVRAVDQTGREIELAVLSCNDDATDSALEERVPLARALLATVLRADRGRLLLLARPSAPPSLRHSLLGLVGTLTEVLAGTSASVSVLFDDGWPADSH